MKRKSKIIFILIIGSLILNVLIIQKGHAGLSSVIQLKTLLVQLEQKINQIKMLYNQTLLVRNQLQNLSKLQNINVTQWSTALESLRQLRGIMDQSTGTAYKVKGLTKEVQRIYEEYKPTENFQEENKRIIKKTKEINEGVLEEIDSQNANLNKDIDEQKRIEGLSGDANGQLEAIQAGTKMSSLIAYNLLAQRKIMLSQAASLKAFQNEQLWEKDAEQKMLEETAHRIPEGRNSVDLTNSFKSGR